MYRLIILLAVAGLLVACDAARGPAADGSPGTAGSFDAAGAGAAPVASASAACNESFGPLAEMEVGALSDLGDLPNEVGPTIEACESIADWTAGAQQLFDDEINPNTVRFLLQINCNDLSLANTPICEEL
jgi:hypothetical protein